MKKVLVLLLTLLGIVSAIDYEEVLIDLQSSKPYKDHPELQPIKACVLGSPTRGMIRMCIAGNRYNVKREKTFDGELGIYYIERALFLNNPKMAKCNCQVNVEEDVWYLKKNQPDSYEYNQLVAKQSNPKVKELMVRYGEVELPFRVVTKKKTQKQVKKKTKIACVKC